MVERRTALRGGLLERTVWTPWAALVLGVILTSAIPDESASASVRLVVGGITTVLFALLLWRLVLAARRRPDDRLSLAVLATSLVVWAVGASLTSTSQAVGEVHFPAPGDFLCFGAYLGLAVFVLLDVPRRTTPLSVWIEAGVTWGATICLATVALVAPISGLGDESGLALVAAVVFPLVNLVLAAMVGAQVVLRNRAASMRTWLLLAGFVLLTAGDSNFLATASQGPTYTSSIVVAALWGVGFTLIGEAATRRRRDDTSLTIQRTSPYLLLAAAGVAVVALVLRPVGVLGGVAVGMAVITLGLTGWRMQRALVEARGAADAMRLSLTDELTGLPNRRALMQATDHALQHRGPASVILLDLDAFKDINDSLGHAVGDDVLVALAARLERSIQPGTHLARLGGDEFGLLVPSEDDLDLFEVAQETRNVLREPLFVHGIDVSIDSSAGIARRQEDDVAGTELLRRADIAMYEAKTAGAGVLVYDAARDGLSHLRLQRGEALRTAIAEHQLLAWYQPQVDARTRQVVAMEALVRWWHPAEGLLPPATFLSDARRAGLMPALTEVVMHQVIDDATRWRAQGMSFRIAMNWAPPELMGGSPLQRFFAALEESGLPADSILVEVTEDSFLTDPERARSVLHDLRAHGVEVSIDDYGSGFSSLAYLRDLPVQELKMDRSFVAPVSTDERSRLIVQTTSQMARAMGLRFVAEGVEDARGAADLVPLGVDVLQGYHIARPMPPEAVLPWVRDWTARHMVRSGGASSPW